MDKRIYTLKNFNENLLKFEVVINDYGSYEFNTVCIEDKKLDLLPKGLEVENIRNWISGRTVPKNREFVNEILKSLGDISHPMAIIDVSLGLSLNDSYWITPERFVGSFEEYNLYDNPFSEALKLVAFTGNGEPVKGIATSPELTTNGMLKKCWHREEGRTYLYKGGTFGFANTGLEPYSEYYASQISKRMGIKSVEYDLLKFKHELVSSCELFTSKDIGFVPIWKLTDTSKIDNIVKLYGKQDFADMLTLDAVICNTDRHLGNFGMLVENRTGRVMIPAPIFDNGLSLFCYAMEDDFKIGIDLYANNLINAFGANPVIMAKSVKTGRQIKMLRNLINFKFERHPKYNLPEWRLSEIEKFIQNRINLLISI